MTDRIKQLLRNQKVFLICWLLLIITMSVVLVIAEKQNLHVALNDAFNIGYGTGLHTPFGDIFFRYFTMIAEYIPYVIVVVLLFYNYGWTIIAALGQLCATLTTQILKHIVNAPRPKTFFEQNYPDLIPQLHWVEGVNMHSWFSFPSGHTTAFFSLFFVLSLMLTDNKKISHKWLIQILCFLCATLGGYSRIYLSQHFTADVLAGCVIGVLLTAVIYILPWPQNQPWADKSLIKK